MSLANALTLLRLLLVAPFAWLMAQPDRGVSAWAAALLLAAIATDLLDGPLARRRGVASAAGKAFDHTTDFLFVVGGLFAGAARGAWAWALPGLVCTAFAQYVIDSRFIFKRGPLQANWLGRANGILYFAPLCVDVAARLGAIWLEPFLPPLAWLLVATTVVSMAMRLRAALTHRAE